MGGGIDGQTAPASWLLAGGGCAAAAHRAGGLRRTAPDQHHPAAAAGLDRRGPHDRGHDHDCDLVAKTLLPGTPRGGQYANRPPAVESSTPERPRLICERKWANPIGSCRKRKLEVPGQPFGSTTTAAAPCICCRTKWSTPNKLTPAAGSSARATRAASPLRTSSTNSRSSRAAASRADSIATLPRSPARRCLRRDRSASARPAR